MLLIIMMRASKEYKFSTYGILILNREQFTNVRIIHIINDIIQKFI